VALRGIMEACIVVALGIWGYHIGSSQISKILFTGLAPAIGFGFWGAVDFHQFGKRAETFRLIQELVVSGLAALSLYSTGAHLWAWLLAMLSIIHHALVYLLGERLLKKAKETAN
ncbi:MAG TPA: YrdB family protein, partial [Sunxiuqinia sp.]|nr:YrdB family protein [Sunxiuqinia sp.]